MPSPFPGMDPYLENPEIFPDLHDSLITYLRAKLQAGLPPPYYAAIGRRVWIEASRRSIEPDVHVLRAGAARQVPSPTSGATAVTSRSAARPVIVKVLHDEFREPFLEIYAGSGDSKRLVTSIEVLSLSNKTPGEQGANCSYESRGNCWRVRSTSSRSTYFGRATIRRRFHSSRLWPLVDHSTITSRSIPSTTSKRITSTQ